MPAPIAAPVNDLGDALRLRGIPLQGSAKAAIFRNYRDLRFAKDKTPYKTHIDAALTRDGQIKSPGVLYLHIEPTCCFAASGFYQPTPEVLAEIRSVIASHVLIYSGAWPKSKPRAAAWHPAIRR